MNKILSIAISAYNKEKYLDRCIKSLLIPSLDLLEIIVVNDGSQDRTSEIAHSYEAQYPNSIIVVDKENGHQGSCINAGLKLFKGKYFKTLDADDFFDTEVLEYIVGLLSESNADMVVAGHVICGATNLSIQPKNVDNLKIYNLAEISFKESGNSECLGMHGVLYRGDIFRDNNILMSEKSPSTDTEYCYYPIRHCSTVQFIQRDLYLYQTGIEGQQSSLTTHSQKDGNYRVAKRMIDDYVFGCVNIQINKNMRIPMNRIIISYLGTYILHYFRNTQDHKQVQEIFAIISHDEEWLSEILSVRQYKIKFIEFYYKWGICIYPLTSLFAFIKRLKKS